MNECDGLRANPNNSEAKGLNGGHNNDVEDF